MQDSSGNPVVQTIAGGGDTARIKDLKPDIYTVCLSSLGPSRRCQSVDLIPAPGQDTASFSMEMRVPNAGDAPSDSFTVSVASLAVPSKAQRELQRASEARHRGESKKSVAHLQRALEICPDFAQALNDLGTHYFKTGDYRQAIQLFSRAVELEPASYAGWINLSKSSLALGNYRRATHAGIRALSLRPDDALASSQLALSYYLQNDVEQARRYFLRVAELDPASALTPHLYLARIAFKENRQAEGAQYLRDFIAIHPNASQAEQYQVILRSLVRLAAAGGSDNAPLH
jgi:tetratricopeptide (TPR) repeat protein